MTIKHLNESSSLGVFKHLPQAQKMKPACLEVLFCIL